MRPSPDELRRTCALPTPLRRGALLPALLLGGGVGLGALAVVGLACCPTAVPASSWVLSFLASAIAALGAYAALSLPGLHPLGALIAPVALTFGVGAWLASASTPGGFWALAAAAVLLAWWLGIGFTSRRLWARVRTLGPRAREVAGEGSTSRHPLLLVAAPGELTATERQELEVLTARGTPLVHPNTLEEGLTGRVFTIPEPEAFAPATSGAYLILKRVLDIALTLLALPLALPLIAFTALASWAAGRVWPEEVGPVLFIQERVGLNGRQFRMVKFRTMRVGSDQNGPLYAVSNDDRITRVGRWLRKFRLDELPQLWNVLRGEMSLVGPRPEPVDSAAKFAKRIPGYSLRTYVKPGVTGWAQVRQGYAAGEEETRIKLAYDLYYIEHVSGIFDFYILVATALTVILGRRAR